MSFKTSFNTSLVRPIASRGRIPTGGVDSIVFNDEFAPLSARSISTDSNDSGAGLAPSRHRKNMQPASKVVFDDYSSSSSPEKPTRKRLNSNDSVKAMLHHTDSSPFAPSPSVEKPSRSNRVAPGGRTTIILG